MVTKDVAGRHVPAMKVFGASIKALKNHLFLMFAERGFEIEPKDIRWVLTVPAIWSDAAKQFMGKSANLVNTIYTKLTRTGINIKKCINQIAPPPPQSQNYVILLS
jgi:hypothetical protein